MGQSDLGEAQQRHRALAQRSPSQPAGVLPRDGCYGSRLSSTRGARVPAAMLNCCDTGGLWPSNLRTGGDWSAVG